MEKIPGRPTSNEILNSYLAEKCGALLAKLHSLPVEKLGQFQKDGFEPSLSTSWWDYRKNLVLGRWTKAIETKVDSNFLTQSKTFLNRFYDHFSESDNCLIQCNFRPAKVLFNLQDVTGLIDFESSRAKS